MRMTLLSAVLLVTTTASLSSAQTASEAIARKRALMTIEMRLKSQHPTDHFVLIFDQQATTFVPSASISGRTVARRVQIQNAESHRAIVVDGRKDAAKAVFDFLNSPNDAIGALDRPGSPGVITYRRNWQYRAFRTEGEADRFRQRILRK